jgi:type IV/VI secretion system ImpK/VasF family protein
MTLLELYEPLFQYICRLNRMARSSGNPDYSVVRAELKAQLEDISQKANADAKASVQAKKLELPLLFFIDSLVATSKLKFAEQWHQHRLAYDRNEKSGDEKFYDLLEETLNENSDEATERLTIYYLCLGLGFTGMYAGQPEQLRKYMNTIFPRIRHLVNYDPNARVCEDAYKSVDTRSFLQPPSNRIVFILILFIFLTLSVFVAYYGLFMKASDTLRDSLHQINQQDTVSK